MQVQTILHAASTLPGLWGLCCKTGTRRQKATYHLQNDIKRKENPTGWTRSHREHVSMWAHDTQPPGWKPCRSSEQTLDKCPIYNIWMTTSGSTGTTNNQRTLFADSITRQTSSISLSHCCQGMRGLCKVTLTKCLGVSWEKCHWHYINFMSLF